MLFCMLGIKDYRYRFNATEQYKIAKHGSSHCQTVHDFEVHNFFPAHVLLKWHPSAPYAKEGRLHNLKGEPRSDPINYTRIFGVILGGN